MSVPTQDYMTVTAAVVAHIRAILREDDRRVGQDPQYRVSTLRMSLKNLERNLPSRDPEAFDTPNLDAFGYATVLGYITETFPQLVEDLEDPVRDTIALGVKAVAMCHASGLKVVKVPACQHVKERYPKVLKVNAYPKAVLEKVFKGWPVALAA